MKDGWWKKLEALDKLKIGSSWGLRYGHAVREFFSRRRRHD